MVVLLLLALILFGVGFTLHILWWVAVAVLVMWLLGGRSMRLGRR